MTRKNWKTTTALVILALLFNQSWFVSQSLSAQQPTAPAPAQAATAQAAPVLLLAQAQPAAQAQKPAAQSIVTPVQTPTVPTQTQAGAFPAASFPYVATLTMDNTLIRSGPGAQFYATDRGRKGDVVEVYKHTYDGWCAIRPPVGSFSFVSASLVQMYKGNLGRIIGDKTPCYVGSRLSPDKSYTQVMLSAGKIVEVLATQPVNAAGFYQISPPSGEFRWIHGSQLSPNRTGVDAIPNTSSTYSPLPATTAASPSGTPALPQGTFDELYGTLEMDTAYIMSQSDIATWETEDLLARAERLQPLAVTQAQKDKLEALKKKLERADNLRKESLKYNQIVSDNRQQKQPAPAPATLQLPAPPANTDAAQSVGWSQFKEPYSSAPGRWDYQGILVRVQPQTYDDFSLPKFALRNEHGFVLCFVTPPPGVDFTQYEGKRISLAGTRDYIKSQRTFNLQVREIVGVEK